MDWENQKWICLPEYSLQRHSYKIQANLWKKLRTDTFELQLIAHMAQQYDKIIKENLEKVVLQLIRKTTGIERRDTIS
jgi:hypothetical protein